MTLCPIALAIGCQKCPVFKVCPVKSVIGDMPKSKEAAPTAKAAPKPVAKSAARTAAARKKPKKK